MNWVEVNHILPTEGEWCFFCNKAELYPTVHVGYYSGKGFRRFLDTKIDIQATHFIPIKLPDLPE